MHRVDESASAPPSASLSGSDLRYQRHLIGFTQAELAAVLGVTATTIARWERGERPISSSGSLRLALERLRDRSAATAPRNQPPAPLTPLVGHTGDVENVRVLLTNHRLVTLTGTGGVGKTRLGIEIARRLQSRFADGVAFIPLDSARDPDLVVDAIGHALQVSQHGGQSMLECLCQFLSRLDILLLIDNFEHVMPAAPAIAALLEGAERVTVLVTSRGPLRLSGEYLYSVPTLTFPTRGATPTELDALLRYEAVQLFLDRARAVRPDFKIDAASAAAVADICCRLDGLPLAVELAAARMRALSAHEIATQVSNALTFLVDGSVNGPARHTTLEAAIGWSYDLLEARERDILARLAVFARGWTLEAATVVSGVNESEMRDRLCALADHSLVQCAVQGDGKTRFWLLDSVREYALRKLASADDSSEAHVRHARYFLELAEAVGGDEQGFSADGPASFDRLEVDHDNLQAALRWLIDTDQFTQAVRLAVACWPLWYQRAYFGEARRWLAELLASPQGKLRGPDRAVLLWETASLAARQGEVSLARGMATESVEIARECVDPTIRARTEHVLAATILMAQGELVRARQLLADVIELCEATERMGRQGGAHCNLAEIYELEGHFNPAQAHAVEALRSARRQGSLQTELYALLVLGRSALGACDLSLALSCFEEGLRDCAQEARGGPWVNFSTASAVFGPHGAIWGQRGCRKKGFGPATASMTGVAWP